ncbi:MAG: alpha/beta fold hydrolase, partial [Planctomycetales bacterium]|nr:alpha/beta fold hydrolase [Planctomycetales bacterium]NIM10343.1 alpha/beta fold hydrolase [Planctomycetales bacterium]NIN09777.1 alpha/beta fold hydrolase [Planctomycetales bacterium]NIN78900.1 alpha/beta fold hydrolase [Planctomycetales bacterium]NIP05955.1 alpha/beta fold hydrolase [Planctomycetales bacterium]
VWAGEAGTKTPFSVVYLHGFSASLEEIRPVPDRVAETLGANLFYTRFTGHGRDGAAMTEPRAGDWINDTAEALEVGRRLGERVIVISTSTGATLASLAETAKTQDTEIAAHVMISPNFALNSRLAFLLDLPAVRYWAPLVAGKEAGFEPVNDQQEYFWTTRYPTQAVMPMAALVRENRGRDVALARAPALFLISDEDKVVRPDVTRRISENWGGGGTVVQLRLGEGDDPYKHVLAGDIVSP